MLRNRGRCSLLYVTRIVFTHSTFPRRSEVTTYIHKQYNKANYTSPVTLLYITRNSQGCVKHVQRRIVVPLHFCRSIFHGSVYREHIHATHSENLFYGNFLLYVLRLTLPPVRVGKVRCYTYWLLALITSICVTS